MSAIGQKSCTFLTFPNRPAGRASTSNIITTGFRNWIELGGKAEIQVDVSWFSYTPEMVIQGQYQVDWSPAVFVQNCDDKRPVALAQVKKWGHFS